MRINKYQQHLDKCLQFVSLPACLVNCDGGCCDDNMHTDALNDYYDQLIAAVQYAVKCTVPSTLSRPSNRYNVPGWNTQCA